MDSSVSVEDIAVKAVNKRYEALVTVRNKAVKGKGAWYWAHLEPVLVHHTDTGLPKSVKLKCSLCDSAFSASNPSRTASEHLKKGACPNFSYGVRPSSSLSPLPISSVSMPSSNNHRKRSSQVGTASYAATPYQNNSLAMVETTRFLGEPGCSTVHNSVGILNNSGLTQQHFVLSGGKEDLGALAMFEDSVKKLKSPKTSPAPTLSKEQINSAVGLLADWFYESCGSSSLSSLEHPKFQTFLSRVGLPAIARRDFTGSRLDAKFHEVKSHSEAKIRDAVFFQVATDGWKCRNRYGLGCGGDSFVKFIVNLPNGASIIQNTVFTGGVVSPKHAEEIMWENVKDMCGSMPHKCVGIVADRYKAQALRNLEIQNHWMVNISCQLQGLLSLTKDLNKELPLFKVVAENCMRVANFVNSDSQVRNCFVKYRMEELEDSGLLRVPSPKCGALNNLVSVFAMFEDMLNCSTVLQMIFLDDSFKLTCVEDPLAREVAGIVQSERFWNDLEAVYSLMTLIRGITQEVEAERPLIGRCLSLWEELRAKVKEWCIKYGIIESPLEKIIEKRFRKNYHPAWAAAFILDPFYLIKDSSGKYLPPFKCLTHEQEKDVDKLLTRLVSKEEAHIVLMELMKWRSEGLDPLYAQAVQIKQPDPVTGKLKIANPQSSRLVWETCLSEFRSLGKIAVRLIFLHATSFGFKINWSFMRRFCVQRYSRVAIERAQKMVFIAAHAKLERQDFSNEEEKDAELLAVAGAEDGMLSESWDWLNL